MNLEVGAINDRMLVRFAWSIGWTEFLMYILGVMAGAYLRASGKGHEFDPENNRSSHLERVDAS